MEYITLKNSDLKVSRIAMGGCPMGRHGWGEVSEKELVSAVKKAIENGINFFDTADTYGLGESERILAKGIGKKRKDIIIQTKFGVIVNNGATHYNNSPNYIKNALEKSLSRLNTDYVDIYTIHYRDKTPIEAVMETLINLKKQGKIRYIGLSNVYSDTMEEYIPFKGQFVNFQDEFSLACKKNTNSILKVSETLNITPMTWGSLGQGILTGKYDINSTFSPDDRRNRDIYVNFHGEKLKQNLKIVELLKKIAEDRKTSVASCAIRFILDYFKDSVVIAGIKRSDQLKSNLEAFNFKFNKEEMKLLEDIS